MKALVGAFNQEKALVGAFSVIVKPVVEPMDRFTALIWILDINITFLQSLPVLCVWERGPRVIRDDISSSDPGGWRSLSFSIIPTSDRD